MTASASVDLPGVDEMSAADLLSFAADPAAHLRGLQDRHGDVFRNGPGQVFVGHAELVQSLLARTNRDAAADIDVLGDLRTPTSKQVEGWMRARRIASNAFRAPSVSDNLGKIDDVLRDQLRGLVGRTFDPMDRAPELFVHAALPLCVSEFMPDLPPASATAARTFLDVLDGGIGAAPEQLEARQRAARAAKVSLRALTDEVVTRESSAGSCPGHPHTVLDATRELSPAVRSHLLGAVLSAASVVPGAALAWLFYELGNHPAEAARIRAEARLLPADLDGVDLGDVLPYARGFVNEVLRLYPPTWVSGRGISEPIELGGRRLPANQFVSFSPYLLHRDPRWWDEPEKFAPERWLGARPPHAPHAFLPFGAGTRVCIATHLGTAILTLAAARLASEYTVKITKSETVTPRFGVPLRPENLRADLIRTAGCEGSR